MFPRNLFVIGWLVTAMAVVLLIYGYISLVPILFICGIALAAVMAGWIAYKIDTKALVIFVILSLVIGYFDEYAHTSSGILTYYDLQTPSFLTVIGWPLFILMIIAFAELVMTRVKPPDNLDNKYTRLVIGLVPVILIPILAIIQGYAGLFDWVLIVVYIVLGVLSLYFVMSESYGRNLMLLIGAVLIGGFMEYLGALEGLWWYSPDAPLAFFMAFTWVIRTWAILGILTLFKVRTSESRWTLWLPRDPIAKALQRGDAKESTSE